MEHPNFEQALEPAARPTKRLPWWRAGTPSQLIRGAQFYLGRYSPARILAVREDVLRVLGGGITPEDREQDVQFALDLVRSVEESGAEGPGDLATNYKKYR